MYSLCLPLRLCLTLSVSLSLSLSVCLSLSLSLFLSLSVSLSLCLSLSLSLSLSASLSLSLSASLSLSLSTSLCLSLSLSLSTVNPALFLSHACALLNSLSQFKVIPVWTSDSDALHKEKVAQRITLLDAVRNSTLPTFDATSLVDTFTAIPREVMNFILVASLSVVCSRVSPVMVFSFCIFC